MGWFYTFFRHQLSVIIFRRFFCRKMRMKPWKEINWLWKNGFYGCWYDGCPSNWRFIWTWWIISCSWLWLAFMFQFWSLRLQVKNSSEFKPIIIKYFRPSLETYGRLLEFSQQNGSFDGGDQGLLNSFFSDWSTANINRILPFGYNVHAAATYTYAPAYKQFANDVRVIHFLGSSKPWTSQQPPSSGGQFNSFWNVWWKFYTNNYSPQGKPL